MWEKIKEHKIFWLGFGAIVLLGGWMLFAWLFPSRTMPVGKAPGVGTALTTPPLESILPPGEPAPVVEAPGLSPAAWAAFPRELGIFKIANPPLSGVDPSFWARRFGFTGESYDEGFGKRRWTGYRKIFRFDQEENSFSYLSLAAVEKGELTLEQLQARARSYLQKAGLDQKGELSPQGYNFKKGGESDLATVRSLIEADRLVFYFAPTVNNLPVLGEEEEPPTQIVLDRAGQLLALRHRLWEYQVTLLRQAPLKDYATVLREVSEGRGKVVRRQGSGWERPPLSSAQVDRIRLAYYFPRPGQTELWPIFVLAGAGPTGQRGLTALTVFLWAVSP